MLLGVTASRTVGSRSAMYARVRPTSTCELPRPQGSRLPASASERPSRGTERFQTPRAFSLAGMIRPIPCLSCWMGASERVESNAGSLCNPRAYARPGRAAHLVRTNGRLDNNAYAIHPRGQVKGNQRFPVSSKSSICATPRHSRCFFCSPRDQRRRGTISEAQLHSFGRTL